MKFLNLTSLFLLYSFSIFSQGSGSSLDFDGANDFVAISPLNTNVTAASVGLPTTAITVEGWVNINSFGSWESMVSFIHDAGGSEYGWQFGVHSGNKFQFGLAGGGIGITYLQTTNSYSVNEWYHIAAVYDGTTMSIYVNGVLDGTSTAQSGDIFYIDTRFSIGRYDDFSGFSAELDGTIDEVRIWSTARTQAQIRDNMCKLLDGTEIGLTHYWKFDDASGTTLTATTGGINGTLTNMDSASDWVTSEAPLGDAAANLYTNSWGGQTINLTSATRGNFEINSVSGTPEGVHVYRVDNLPNSTTGISPVTNDIYYGTFVVNGTSPTYTAEYDYTNFPEAITAEPSLFLYNRDHNADLTWADLTATVNAASNTLTETSISSSGEFIITGAFGVLPVELLNFTASVIQDNTVRLEWQTASERNNDYFTIERSKSGMDWEVIDKVDGAENSSKLLRYSILDNNPYNGLSYYRLKQTDFNDAFEYSNMVSIELKNADDLSNIKIFPNPTQNGELTLSLPETDLASASLELFNASGQLILEQTISHSNTQWNVRHLPNGMYWLTVNANGQRMQKKVVIQH